jgi:hypothetical protein
LPSRHAQIANEAVDVAAQIIGKAPAALPVSAVAADTPAMCRDTSFVPWEACCTLRAISRVAAPCCSTAAAMAEVI